MIELCQLGTVSSPPSTESRTSILKKKQVGQWWCTPNPNTQEAEEGGGSLSSNLVYREHAINFVIYVAALIKWIILFLLLMYFISHL